MGLIILLIQGILLRPLIENNMRLGKEPDRYQVEFISYVDENDDGDFDEEGTDLNGDGDFDDDEATAGPLETPLDLNGDGDTNDKEYPPDILVEKSSDADGKNVSTGIKRSPINRDAGILAGIIIFYPMLYVFVLIYLVDRDDSPMRVSLWLSIGFAAPVILYIILLFILTILFNLAYAFASVVVGFGAQAAGSTGDWFIDGANWASNGLYGDNVIEPGSASDSLNNSDEGGNTGEEVGSFLDSQWEMIGALGAQLFFTFLAMFLTFFAVSFGIQTGETRTLQIARGWSYGVAVQLLALFGVLTLFGLIF
jgi:hypothetical protein